MKRFILCMLLLYSCMSAQNQEMTVELGVKGEIQFILTDPMGRREGIDPRSGARYREINNSYGVYSVDSEDPDFPAPPPIIEFISYSPIPGEYGLTLYGVGRSRYEIDGFLMVRPLRLTFSTRGVIDSLQSAEYRFHLDTTGRKPWFKKIVGVHSLRQDLDNCYKLELLGARPLYIDFSHRVAKYEEAAGKGASRAKHELEKFKKKLDEVYEKTKRATKEKNHFVTDLAYRILKEDIEVLLKANK